MDHQEGNFGGRSRSSGIYVTRGRQPRLDEREEQAGQRAHHKNTLMTTTGKTLQHKGQQVGLEPSGGAGVARRGKQKPGLGGLPQPSEGVSV